MTAAMKYHLSQLREEETCQLEFIQSVHGSNEEGKEGTVHTTQDLQTCTSRLLDRQIFGWGRWRIPEEDTVENISQWMRKYRFGWRAGGYRGLDQ